MGHTHGSTPLAGRLRRVSGLILTGALVAASFTSPPLAQAFGSSTPPPGPPSVNAGGYMTCGIRADAVDPAIDRTAACWGDNVSEGPGQATPPAGMQFSEVNSGYSHACGVRYAPGTADHRTGVCWGSSINNATVTPVGMKFSHMAPGFVHTCGLRHDKAVPANDKTAVCWGANDAQQVTNVPAGVKFTQLTVGIRHDCGLRETPVAGKNIVCWGSDLYGQVSNVPSGTFVALNSGNFDICALTATGSPQCWGRNAAGQHIAPAGETFTQISVGFQHICGLRPNGTVLCCGRNTEGQALAPAGTFNNVSAGTFHSCAMGTDGKAVCWGNNAAGRVQPEMTSDAPIPVAVVGAPYSHQFTSTHMAPISWSVTGGALPPGLALDSGTGLLSGTPSQAGTFPNITVSATNGMASASETFTITVVDDSVPTSPPTVAVGDVSVHEGAGGTRAAVFTVSLSEPSSSTVTVDYATADATATAPSDYQAKAGTLSIAPGATSVTVKVPVAGDAADEADETFDVTLSSPGQATLGDATGVGTIVDDDPGTGKRLAIGDVTVHEGDEGARVAVFNVSLSKASTGTVTVSFATADGTAVSSGDYTATSGTLTFSPGTLQRSVKVTINPDTTIEAGETFTVELSDASGAVITDASGVGSIVDDDGGL